MELEYPTDINIEYAKNYDSFTTSVLLSWQYDSKQWRAKVIVADEMLEAKGYSIYHTLYELAYSASKQCQFNSEVEAYFRKKVMQTPTHVVKPIFNEQTDITYSKMEQYNQKLAQSSSIATFAKQLPGIESKVDYPCICRYKTQSTLYNIIMHLNDGHHENSDNGGDVWSRERIADWLDKKHDNGEINIEFQPWEDVQKAEVEKQKNAPPTAYDKVGYVASKILEFNDKEYSIGPLNIHQTWPAEHIANSAGTHDSSGTFEKDLISFKVAQHYSLHLPAVSKETLAILTGQPEQDIIEESPKQKALDKKHKLPNWAKFNNKKGKK